MKSIMDFEKDLISKAFFFYDGKRQERSRKDCTYEKCPLWKGTDSENLAWCNEYAVGFCNHPSEQYGKPHDKLLIKVDDVIAISAKERKDYDFVVRNLNYIIDSLNKERKERQQKLQQFYDFMVELFVDVIEDHTMFPLKVGDVIIDDWQIRWLDKIEKFGIDVEEKAE